MNININTSVNWKKILLAVVLLAGTNYATYKVTFDKTVDLVVDNITQFCYYNGGSIMKGSNDRYLFCAGVKMDKEDTERMKALDKKNEA